MFAMFRGISAVTAKDILIVAPFNAQVADLIARLPDVPIETVDKFQGQEAPVVIYSLTTSSPEDAPRGNGISLQPESPKRSHFESDVHRNFGRKSAAFRAGVPESQADAAGQRVVPISGIGHRC
jgi:hypothetical protein